MKRIFFSFLFVLLLANIATAFASFNDVNSGYVYYDAITYMQKQGIVSGYSDGSYEPESLITRAEFTKIFVEGMDPDVLTLDNCVFSNEFNFSDVKKSDWYYKYVCFAYKNGYVNGYLDKSFKPSRNIVFYEAAKIVASKYAKTEQFDKELTDGAWAMAGVNALAEKKAIPVSVEYDSDLNRGEMAEILYRLLNNITNKSSQAVDLDKADVLVGESCLGIDGVEYDLGSVYEPNSYSKCTCDSVGWECYSQKDPTGGICFLDDGRIIKNYSRVKLNDCTSCTCADGELTECTGLCVDE